MLLEVITELSESRRGAGYGVVHFDLSGDLLSQLVLVFTAATCQDHEGSRNGTKDQKLWLVYGYHQCCLTKRK